METFHRQVVLTSGSNLKGKVLQKALKESFGALIGNGNEDNLWRVFKYPVNQTPTPQPLNEATRVCCQNRIDSTPHSIKESADFVVSIENGILETETGPFDYCHVILEGKDFKIESTSSHVPVPKEFYHEGVEMTPKSYKEAKSGLVITIGELINRKHPDVPANNWMGHEMFGFQNREEQIYKPLMDCLLDYKLHVIDSNLLEFPDFPKEGIIFRDLSKVLGNSVLLNFLVSSMAEFLTKRGLDTVNKIVGLDSRGFIYGPLLTYQLNAKFSSSAGFVMMRKAGKLPGKKVGIDYSTEYSTDTIELMQGTITEGDRVLIVDDLVATGGSLLAAKSLVEKAGGSVEGCFTVLQVNNLLNVAKKKLGKTPIYVLID